MFFIWGRSGKQQVLQQWGAQCGHCNGHTTHQLVRLYRVAHFFWFPLFSTNERFVQVCTACGASAPVAHPGGAVPNKPLLHRLGFVFPLLGVVALFSLVGALVVVVGMSAKVDPVLAARTKRLDALEAHLGTPGAWGNNPKAQDVASAARSVFGSFKDAKDRDHASVAVDLLEGPPRQAVIAVQISSLRKWQQSDRRRLLKQLADAVEPKLGDDTKIVIGVKGELLFGPLAVRAKKGAWSFDPDNPDAEDRLRDAYARVVKASPSASASGSSR